MISFERIEDIGYFLMLDLPFMDSEKGIGITQDKPENLEQLQKI